MSARIHSLLVAASVLLPAVSVNAKTICKHGGQERSVEVAYLESGKKAPCEVKYAKDSKGEAKTIFTAKTQTGYCESKAAEFVDKLKGMGLECSGD